MVDALPGNARDSFVLSRRGTLGATAPAVEDVRGEIGAVTATAGLSVRPAVIAAGPAVRVRLEVAADPLAGCDRAAGVTAARSGETAGVAVARLAGRKTLA